MDPDKSNQPANSPQDNLRSPAGENRRQGLVEDIAKEFQAAVAPRPGFREGSARAPERYREAIEVTSWLQVPSILNKLQSGAAQDIRLLFPNPKTSATAQPQYVDAFIEEQWAIAEFIKANHSQPIETIRNLLSEKIEQSFSLAMVRATKSGAEDLTGAEWVDATLPPVPVSKSLNVTTFFPIGQKAISSEATVNSLVVSLLEAVQKERPIALTIADTNMARLSELAAVLDALRGPESVLHNVSDGLGLHTKVWVGPYATKLNTKYAPNSPCPEVREYTLQEFIDKFKPSGPSDSGPGARVPPSTPPTPPTSIPSAGQPASPPPSSGPTPPSDNQSPAAPEGANPSEQAAATPSGSLPTTTSETGKAPTSEAKGEQTGEPAQAGSAQTAPSPAPFEELTPPATPQAALSEPRPPRKGPTLQERVEMMAEDARTGRGRRGGKKEEALELATQVPDENPQSPERE
jgi:hypothetical protein